jgi:hypothetical protein
MSDKEINGRIGIIACGGDVPWHVAKSCHDPFIIGLKSFADPEEIKGYEHEWYRIGAIGKIIKSLKKHDVKDLCLIGSLGKPGLSSLRPDLTALKFLSTINYADLGDDGLLRAIRGFLEKQGFTIHGAHVLAPDLLTPSGIMTKAAPDSKQDKDIEIGMAAAQKLGDQDKGQAVLILGGKVIANEGREGTSTMIDRAGAENAVLVKMCKPSQDRDLDLPTIGIETVQKCIDKKMAGIAIHAGESLFIDREQAIALADKNGLFIKGVTI